MAAGNILRLKPLEYAHVLDLVSFTVFFQNFYSLMVYSLLTKFTYFQIIMSYNILCYIEPFVPK